MQDAQRHFSARKEQHWGQIRYSMSLHAAICTRSIKTGDEQRQSKSLRACTSVCVRESKRAGTGRMGRARVKGMAHAHGANRTLPMISFKYQKEEEQPDPQIRYQEDEGQDWSHKVSRL